LLVAGRLPPLETGLALAAGVVALEALAFAPLLLPAAVALFGAGLVVSMDRGVLPRWSVPLFAVGLLLLHEAGELRYRVPAGSVVEAAPLRALARRIALTAALGLVASAAVVAASSLPSRGGAAAAIVGSLAVAAVLLLVRRLADARPSASR
jgi:hypothetical protein